MLKQYVLYGLLVFLAILVFSPVVQSGQEIYVLFDFDPLLLLFTGEGDPTVLSARYVDWYPNVGALRIILSGILACVAVYKVWTLDTPAPALGTTEAGRRSKAFLAKDRLDEDPEAAPDIAGTLEAKGHP